MLISEERAHIVGMCEGGMKCLNIGVILNVLQLTIPIVLTNGKVHGNVKSLIN